MPETASFVKSLWNSSSIFPIVTVWVKAVTVPIICRWPLITFPLAVFSSFFLHLKLKKLKIPKLALNIGFWFCPILTRSVIIHCVKPINVLIIRNNFVLVVTVFAFSVENLRDRKCRHLRFVGISTINKLIFHPRDRMDYKSQGFYQKLVQFRFFLEYITIFASSISVLRGQECQICLFLIFAFLGSLFA